MLPRTFSLARLLIGITVVAAFCGLAVQFPLDLQFAALDAAVLGLMVVALIMLLRRPRPGDHSLVPTDERLDQQNEIHRLLR